MKKLILIALLLTTNAQAFKAYNSSNQFLGHFYSVKLSTGLTGSQTNGQLTLVSSPSLSGTLTLENAETLANSTDDTVQVASNDEHTTFEVLGFEAKDAILNLYADQGDDSADKFRLRSSAANAFSIDNNASALFSMSSAGAVTMVGSLTGDGGDALSGFLQSQVASSTTSLTAAQCGSTIVSNSADVMTLPEASTVLGCQYTFVCGTADDLDVNPADGTDQIGPALNSVAAGTGAAITPSAGDAIRCTDIGSSITLEAVGANLWAPIGVGNGAWTDVN